MQLPTEFSPRRRAWRPVPKFDLRDQSTFTLSKQYDCTSDSRIRRGRCPSRCLHYWTSGIAERRWFEKGNWRFAILLNRRTCNLIRQNARDRMASCDIDVERHDLHGLDHAHREEQAFSH